MKEPARSNYDLQVDIGKELFLAYDQELLIRKFGLQADADWLFLTYMNTPCRISRIDGRVEEQTDGSWRECRNFGTVMTLYDLLCYSKGSAAPVLFGQWCTSGNFIVTGVQSSDAFTRKYADFFQDRTPLLRRACQALGGELLAPLAGADVTCRLLVTDFFPVLLQFWQKDEDFPPKLMLLWDRNTTSFLHFETTFYLQGDLLERLKQKMECE